MSEHTILIVDDEPQILLVLSDRLRMHGYRTLQARNGVEALQILESETVDLMLLDQRMPELDGMGVLRRMRDLNSEVPAILLTAHGSIDQAVEAMKLGAIDFLTKPCNPDHILLVLQKVLRTKEVINENINLRKNIEDQYQMILGQTDRMKQIMKIVDKVAKQNASVLISGESGTGKQLLARAIHQKSQRSDRPFVQITCTTLHENLTESDLFGHEKGAFTGAVRSKKGRFELADNGTMFLDEIGDLAPSIQAKLLRVLEYGEFQRLGGVHTLKSDVRIVAATNKRLDDEVKNGNFREDLFFRINVVHIELPPLRDRMEDLPLFAYHFLKKHSQAMRKPVDSISEDTMQNLSNYHWPGNIRELENIIERAVVLASESRLTADLLPPLQQNKMHVESYMDKSLEQALHNFKRNYVLNILEKTNFNQTQAAKILNIQRTYLNRLIKQLDIERNFT